MVTHLPDAAKSEEEDEEESTVKISRKNLFNLKNLNLMKSGSFQLKSSVSAENASGEEKITMPNVTADVQKPLGNRFRRFFFLPTRKQPPKEVSLTNLRHVL